MPWRPSKWGRLCAEAQLPTMTFADLGHIIVDLSDSLPTTFRKYLVQLTLPLEDPSPLFRRQRDLLPLPVISFVDGDLPRKCSEARGSVSYESARYAWTLLMLSAVNCEYHLATRNGAARPLFGPATPTQTEAVKRLAVAADLMCSLNPSQIGERDWQEELKSCRIRYDGSEAATAESVTPWQIEPALPAPGIAGTVDLAQLPGGRDEEAASRSGPVPPRRVGGGRRLASTAVLRRQLSG